VKGKDLENVYLSRYGIPFSGETYQRAIQRDIKVAKDTIAIANAKICDLCCGVGTHLVALGEDGRFDLTGVDFCPQAKIQFDRNRGSKQGIRFEVAEAVSYSEGEANSFDAVLCYFPHLDKRTAAESYSLLFAIYRLCRVGGRAVISVFCADYADRLVGDTIASYHSSNSVTLRSIVSYSRVNGELVIRQTSSAWKGDLVERMVLYSIEDLQKLLLDVGFQTVKKISTIAGLREIADAQRTEEGKVTLIAEKSR
jgi:SAM-dependent methyltransferase